MRYPHFTLALVSAALAGAAAVFAWDHGYAQANQLVLPAPAAHETVKVIAPASRLQPFDMKQCRDGDDDHCQMATCVSVLTRDGDIVVCQSHGNFFP